MTDPSDQHDENQKKAVTSSGWHVACADMELGEHQPDLIDGDGKDVEIQAGSPGGHTVKLSLPASGDNSMEGGNGREKSSRTDLSANYEMLGLIGKGAMGAVYKARHHYLGKLVAIKKLHVHFLSDKVQLERFFREGKALSRLHHANIVAVSDCGITVDEEAFIVMDYLNGRSLDTIFDSEGILPVDRAINISAQICDALEYAHSHGIVHRDIKPSNVVLVSEDEKNDVVKIVDFGIAKIALDSEKQPELTQTGEIFGSPLYMSPEQCQGQVLDGRSDIYSLACLLYEILSGHPPFENNNLFAVLNMHMNEVAPPLTIPGCESTLAARLDAIIFKALEKDREKRYQSMSMFKHDLLELLDEKADHKGTGNVSVKLSRSAQRAAKVLAQHPIRNFSVIAAAFVFGLMVIAASVYTFLALSPGYAQLNSAVSSGPSLEALQFRLREFDAAPENRPSDFDAQCTRLRSAIDSALASSQQSGIDKENAAELCMQFGKYCQRFGQYDDAIKTYRQAEQIYHTLYEVPGHKKDARVALCQDLVGQCYDELNEYFFARPEFKSSFGAYASITGKQDAAGIAELRLARDLQRSGNIYFKEAADLYHDYLTHHQPPSKNADLFAAVSEADCIGSAAFLPENQMSKLQRKQDLMKAEQVFKKFESIWQAKDPYNFMVIKFRLADISAQLGNWADAAENYRQGLNLLGSNQCKLGDETVRALKDNCAKALWRSYQWFAALQETRNRS